MSLRSCWRLILSAVVCLHGAEAAAQDARWEPYVAAFEAADQSSPPPRGQIVFVGSSSIQRWDLRSSFPDVATINRGIDGTEMRDFVRYADRLILPYEPRLVVVYAGDNDIASGKTAEEVAAQFDLLVARIHARLPETRIVVIGLKPSLQRWALIDRMRTASALLRARCAQDDRIACVDIDSPMLGWDERPRPELFVTDGLHLSKAGYQVWADLVRPFLRLPPALDPVRPFPSAAAR